MIRRATYDDLPALMDIFSKARGIMRTSGNMKQWNSCYPSEAIIRKDISEGNCVVLCEKGKIVASMSFIEGPDPTYAEIHRGQWLSDKPYHVIHRIAACEPGHNAAKTLLDWGFGHTRSIRIDTHEDNVIMHHILKKYGFVHCGMIRLANGEPREAYQKDI